MSDIAALRDEVDRLRAENRYLKTELTTGPTFPLSWKLTLGEERVLRALLARPLVSKSMLAVALYSDRQGDQPAHKIFDVWVCKLRAKLKGKVKIETVYGRGWSIDARTREMLKACRL